MKHLACLLSLVLAIFFVVSCGTAQTVGNVPPYIITGDKPIYPAVSWAVVNGEPSVWIESTPTFVGPNTIVIDNVRVMDGIMVADFTLKISVVDNVVTYDFSKRRRKDLNGNWNSIERFSLPGRESIFVNYFNTEIPKLMENDELYAMIKEDMDNNLGWTH